MLENIFENGYLQISLGIGLFIVGVSILINVLFFPLVMFVNFFAALVSYLILHFGVKFFLDGLRSYIKDFNEE